MLKAYEDTVTVICAVYTQKSTKAIVDFNTIILLTVYKKMFRYRLLCPQSPHQSKQHIKYAKITQGLHDI